jgi:hypothetical protein
MIAMIATVRVREATAGFSQEDDPNRRRFLPLRRGEGAYPRISTF